VRVPVWDPVKIKTSWRDIGWTCACLNSYLPEFAQYVRNDHNYNHCGVGILPKAVRRLLFNHLGLPHDAIHWGNCPSPGVFV